VPEKAAFEIRFPRVERYQQAIRNRVTLDRDAVAPLVLDPTQIPPEVEAKAALLSNQGRPTLSGPGRLQRIDLNPFRSGRRRQELVFELARDLTRSYVTQPSCQAPAHVLFPQIKEIVDWYLHERVRPLAPANELDLFLSPYYGWAIERLAEAIRPDASQGEAKEIPLYESSREPGSTGEVEFWTRRDVREVAKSHVNVVVADTQKWEQSAAYAIDTHAAVAAFVKNAGLGFAIPYLHNGDTHDYVPDFLIRLATDPPRNLILETKGFDPLEEVKRAAAERWVAAVNAEGSFGRWEYAVAKRPTDVRSILDGIANT
jgi:type III restriction enzyme